MLNLEGNELFLAFWSWDGGFKVVDKKPLRNFKCEHMKKMMGFQKRVLQSRLTEMTIFKTLLEKLRCKRHWKPPEGVSGDAYISFRTQSCSIWRSIASHSFVQRCNLISSKFENAKKADQGNDIGDFYGRIGM